jgi:hypothetical protein
LVRNPKFNYVVVDELGDRYRRFTSKHDAMNFIAIREGWSITKEVRKDWVDIENFEPCLI